MKNLLRFLGGAIAIISLEELIFGYGQQYIAARGLGFKIADVNYKGLGNSDTSFKFEILVDCASTSQFDIYIQKFDFEILFNHEQIALVQKEQNTLFVHRCITTIPIIVDIDIKMTWEKLLEQVRSGYLDNWLFEIKGTIYTKNIKLPLNLEFNYYNFFGNDLNNKSDNPDTKGWLFPLL
ncbi:MAG: hypothetical protein LBC68_12035 [Prevotellaceae bacterium]|jgi:hypothetical protein|nr:hypothetical protein [Prevotellaceae bacterium]